MKSEHQPEERQASPEGRSPDRREDGVAAIDGMVNATEIAEKRALILTDVTGENKGFFFFFFCESERLLPSDCRREDG